MANPRHVEILTRDGVRTWNQWREKESNTRPNLREADLSGANLREANLREADLREADLREADLSKADLSEAHLFRADLSGANLIEADLTDANLEGCRIYGIAAWNVKLEGATQRDLCITSYLEPEVTVDNLEVAQFLYLLLNNPRVRAVLDTIASKVVLILGRFSEERKPILDALREALRSHPNGYIPVLFDFDPQQDKPDFETVKTLTNLARFVIADLTDPRMVRSELTYITANVPSVPVQPILQRDADLPPEYGTWLLYKSFLPVYRYTDLPQLLASLTEAVIAPVEGHVHARRLADADSAS
jgi:Pentapeptide repeats (8 copies)